LETLQYPATPAVVIKSAGTSRQADHIETILRFFGVDCRLAIETGSDVKSPERARLFCSADEFLSLVEEVELQTQSGFDRLSRIHSAFVYASRDPDTLHSVLKLLIRDQHLEVRNIPPGKAMVEVSSFEKDFCGAMTGLRLEVASAEAIFSAVNAESPEWTSLVSAEGHSVFLKCNYRGMPVFVSTCPDLINIEENLSGMTFDIRESFYQAVPVVLYLKWAFRDLCWSSPEANACLIIDDPPLKPVYGCLNFEELFHAMRRSNFTTSIAFIPWNRQRSDPRVTELFKRNKSCSLSIHGSDHVASEFGVNDSGILLSKVANSLERMAVHQQLTGLEYDKVMVFPHGIFSKAAMTALKHAGFCAAVNSRVKSVDCLPARITISDYWSMALTCYDGFPLFSRRDPDQGIENFAFDAVLGKPCLIVIHHDFCCDGCKDLLNFIQRLNGLEVSLTWRSLGEIARRSYRERVGVNNNVEVRMYGTTLRLENKTPLARRYFISRYEPDFWAVSDVRDNAKSIPWIKEKEVLKFEASLAAGETRVFEVRFHKQDCNGHDEKFSSQVKATVRRYLSEVRDNYVSGFRRSVSSYRSPKRLSSDIDVEDEIGNGSA